MKIGFLTRDVSAASDRRWLRKALLASPFVFAAGLSAPQAFAQIAPGTIMASTGNGKVTAYSQTGTMLGQLDTGTGLGHYTFGSVFDSAGNFYVGYNSAFVGRVTKFNSFGDLPENFGSGYDGNPTSIVHDAAGNFYVGRGNAVLKLSASGTTLASYPITIDSIRNSIEIGADQCTLYFTKADQNVYRFNVCTNTPLSNFNVAPIPKYFGGTVDAQASTPRLLPSGGLLVSDGDLLILLDASGNQIQTYPSPDHGYFLIAIALDPDGTSFWTESDAPNGPVYKVDTASGIVLTSFNTSGAPGFSGLLLGLSVKGGRSFPIRQRVAQATQP